MQASSDILTRLRSDPVQVVIRTARTFPRFPAHVRVCEKERPGISRQQALANTWTSPVLGIAINNNCVWGPVERIYEELGETNINKPNVAHLSRRPAIATLQENCPDKVNIQLKR
jgi:hypothetical protein